MRVRRISLAVVALGLGVFILINGANQVTGEPIKIVSPSSYADTEAPYTTGSTTGEPNARYQQVFLASDFESLPYEYRWITQIAFRPDGDFAGSLTETVTSRIIRLSTTTATPLTLANRFAWNVGADEVVVYDGPSTLTTANVGPAGGPKEFDVVIDLQTPFEYDPQNGNLLLDVTFVGKEYPTIPYDLIPDPSEETKMIINADPDRSTATWSYGGFPFQFTFMPEPSTFLLAVLGLALVSGCRRRC